MTTRIITFLVGNPHKPLFATVTGKGPHPTYTYKIEFLRLKIYSFSMLDTYQGSVRIEILKITAFIFGFLVGCLLTPECQGQDNKLQQFGEPTKLQSNHSSGALDFVNFAENRTF